MVLGFTHAGLCYHVATQHGLLFEERARLTSVLPESHVRCAWDDQATWNSDIVPHSLSSQHAVARCHTDHCPTVRHQAHRRRCENNVI